MNTATKQKQAGSILPFSFDNLPVRGRLISLRDLEEFVPAVKNNTGFVQDLLKQAITAVVLFQQDLKADQSLTLQLISQDGIKLVIAQAMADGTIKAYADVAEDNTIEDFETYVSKNPKIVMTVDNKGKSYQSIIPMVGKSFKDTIIGYYEQSVQNKTYLNFVEHNNTICAMMLQHLPTERVSSDDWNRLAMMADTLTGEEATTLLHYEIIQRLFAEDTVRIFDENILSFYLEADRARMEKAIKSLGLLQCREFLKDGDIEMTDQFSGITETFKHEDIARIFEEMKDDLREIKARKEAEEAANKGE
jgi:molecular chaperone Hsp33